MSLYTSEYQTYQSATFQRQNILATLKSGDDGFPEITSIN